MFRKFGTSCGVKLAKIVIACRPTSAACKKYKPAEHTAYCQTVGRVGEIEQVPSPSGAEAELKSYGFGGMSRLNSAMFRLNAFAL
jgi:hypothetical protein